MSEPGSERRPRVEVALHDRLLSALSASLPELGVVASGTSGGQSTPGHYETHSVTTSQEVTRLDARRYAGDPNLVNEGGSHSLRSTTTQSTFVPGTTAPAYSNFSRRQATCPALRLSSKGAGVGVQTMQMDMLKTMFGGDKGPPTPPGIDQLGERPEAGLAEERSRC